MADGQGRALGSGSIPVIRLVTFFMTFSSSEAPAGMVGAFFWIKCGRIKYEK